VLGVERSIEIEHVAREIGAQLVGSTPAEVLGHVRLGDGRDLREDRNAEEQQRDQDEPLKRLAGLGVVNEDSDDLGVGELQSDSGKQRRPSRRARGHSGRR